MLYANVLGQLYFKFMDLWPHNKGPGSRCFQNGLVDVLLEDAILHTES